MSGKDWLVVYYNVNTFNLQNNATGDMRQARCQYCFNPYFGYWEIGMDFYDPTGTIWLNALRATTTDFLTLSLSNGDVFTAQ